MTEQGKSRARDKRTTFRTTNLHKQNSTAVNPLSTGTSRNSVTGAISEQTTVRFESRRAKSASLLRQSFPCTGDVVDRRCPSVLVQTASSKS